MSLWINHDNNTVADAEFLMKTSLVNDTSNMSKGNLKAVLPKKKAQTISKKTRSKKLRKMCMFRIHGQVEFTKENKAVIKPDVTCSKIVNGKKMFNLGNVICNTCGKCFCSPFMKDTLEKFAIERNCFEKHKELDGSVCKDADFTPLVQMTREEYNRKYKKIREDYNRKLKEEKLL